MLDFSKLTSAQLQSLTRVELPADLVEVTANIAPGDVVVLQVLTETCDFDLEISTTGQTVRITYGMEPGSGVVDTTVVFGSR